MCFDEMVFSDFKFLFDVIFVVYINIIRVYKFDDVCVIIYCDLQWDFVVEVNEEILYGNMFFKLKKIEIIFRVVVCLLVLLYFICQNFYFDILYIEVFESVILQFYRVVVKFVEYMELQKEMFVDFLKFIIEVICEIVKLQLFVIDIKIVIVLFFGLLVIYQVFKKYGVRVMCLVVCLEFEICVVNLVQYGNYVKVRVLCSVK